MTTTAPRKRNASGEFVAADGSQRADRRPRWTKRNALGEFVDARGRNVSDRTRLRAEYVCVLAAREVAALAATNGVLVNRQGERRGILDSRVWGVRPVSRRWWSLEAIHWVDEVGECMTWSEYVAQARENCDEEW